MPKEELEEVISFPAEHGFIVPAENVLHKGPPANVQSGIPHMPAHGEHYSLARHLSPHNSAPVQDATTGKTDESALLQDEERIRQIKGFMTTTATTYLGLLSADVIHRIERAKGAANLMAVVGYWHMALRGSKQGGRFAGPYLEQVTAALTGKTVQIEADQV